MTEKLALFVYWREVRLDVCFNENYGLVLFIFRIKSTVRRCQAILPSAIHEPKTEWSTHLDYC